MRFIKITICYFIAGFTITFFWGFFIEKFGSFGGWVAAVTLITPIWYLNHYKNMVKNMTNAVFIDMGLSIAIANITVSYIKNPKINFFCTLERSLLTLLFLGIGSVLGGYFAFYFDKTRVRKK